MRIVDARWAFRPQDTPYYHVWSGLGVLVLSALIAHGIDSKKMAAL